MQKFIKSIGWAFQGLRTVWHEEKNFRIQFYIAILLVFVGLYLQFLVLEWIIILACIGAVLSAETVNTAIEDLCNKVEPRTDPLIGKVKDIMAGFVLLVSFVAFSIVTLLFSGYF